MTASSLFTFGNYFLKMRLLVISMIIAAMPLSITAREVSLSQASEKARVFLQAKVKAAGEERMVRLSADVYTGEDNAYYVFNVEGQGGFAVIAGDDRAPEVLGYALRGSLNYKDTLCSIHSVLESYALQMERLRKNGGVLTGVPAKPSAPVPMLMQTQWGQNAPYNEHCDLFVTKAPTGCVAVAMAQVLYYHRERSVAQVQATIPGYTCRTKWNVEDRKNLRLEVPSVAAGTPIDWGHMLTTYRDTAAIDKQERAAVASLMRYCGTAVEMEYREKESAANVWSVPLAMKKYFGYNPQMEVKIQALLTADEWQQLLVGELQAARPVILSSETVCGGHVFVCDGIDEAGLYHLNWGWGGQNDGYFVLAPFVEQQTGDATPFFGAGMHAVVPLEPSQDRQPFVEQLRLTTVGLAVGSVDGKRFLSAKKPFVQQRENIKRNVRFGFQLVQRNCTASTGDFESALAMYDKKGRFVQLIEHSQNEFRHFNKTQTHFSSHAFDFGSMIKKGIFHIRPVSRKKGSTEWLPNDNYLLGNHIQVIFKKKEVTIGLVKDEPDKKKKKKK